MPTDASSRRGAVYRILLILWGFFIGLDNATSGAAPGVPLLWLDDAVIRLLGLTQMVSAIGYSAGFEWARLALAGSLFGSFLEMAATYVWAPVSLRPIYWAAATAMFLAPGIAVWQLAPKGARAIGARSSQN